MKSKAFLLLLVTTSLILSACAALATQAPTSIPEILPTPASIVPLSDRQQAIVHIDEHPLVAANPVGNHPDEIVFVQDFIWTRTENGHLVQVDPASDEMVSAVKVDTTKDAANYCQGLGTDGESIWSCSAADDGENRTIDVVRVDPQTQSVVATVKVGKVFEQFELPFLGNQIWVLTDRGEKLVGIDVTTNEPGPAIDLGARCLQLAVAEQSLLAACTQDNLVLRIDPEKKEVVARATVESPRNIAAASNGIWVTQDNGVVRLDLQSLAPIVIFTNLSGVGRTGDIFATEVAVWVRLENGFLYRIDPASNQITEQIKPEDALTGGSVLATSDAVWTTALDDNLLIRLRLE